MAIIGVIDSEIISDVIEIENLKKAEELTGKECIDISVPINLTLLNGTIIPAWIGINWKRENGEWVPPFDIDIPLSVNL